jgi:hypothetical protein
LVPLNGAVNRQGAAVVAGLQPLPQFKLGSPRESKHRVGQESLASRPRADYHRPSVGD